MVVSTACVTLQLEWRLAQRARYWHFALQDRLCHLCKISDGVSSGKSCPVKFTFACSSLWHCAENAEPGILLADDDYSQLIHRVKYRLGVVVKSREPAWICTTVAKIGLSRDKMCRKEPLKFPTIPYFHVSFYTKPWHIVSCKEICWDFPKSDFSAHLETTILEAFS